MLIATAIVLLLGGVVAPQEGPDWARMLEAAEYPLGEAIDRGLKESGDGFPFHAELELDDGAVVYSIDVAQADKTVNVVLDIGDGSVLDREVEDEDHSAAVKACRIPLKAAIETAVKHNPGQPVEAQLSVTSGKPVITVAVFGDAKLSLVRVDGATGEEIGGAPAAQPEPQPAFTADFRVADGDWSSTGRNAFFILEPGHVLVLEGKDDGEDARVTISVLDLTRQVAGVETRVVEEREEIGGKLVEISRNFFAISKATSSVYYFGEEVDIYRDGKVVKHEGAWLAGEDGARFGLIMPGTPLLGARYHQEIAPGVAMDRAEIIGLGETVETPAGGFEGCLKVKESTPLEKGAEFKLYAPGVGLVQEEDLKLTRHGRAGGTGGSR